MKLDVSQHDEIAMKKLVEDDQTTNTNQKTSIPNKLSNPFSCKFIINNDEQQKPLPFARDVQIPKLPIKRNRFVKFFLSSMENLFKKRYRIIKVEDVRIIFQFLSWLLDQETTRKVVWKAKSEDHVDFCVE